MNDNEFTNNDINYLYRIGSKYDSMPKSHKKIEKYLEEHRDEVLNSSITSLAKKIGTTPSAITRFCQALNFRGFAELKFYLEKGFPISEQEKCKIDASDNLSVMTRKTLQMDIRAISDTLLLLNQKNLSIVANMVSKANRIMFYGESSTGFSAGLACSMFMQIGLPCNYYTDSGLMRMSTAVLEKGDIVFGITYSGEAANIIDAIQMADKKNATTVAVTGKVNSTLSELCDYAFTYSSSIEDELTSFPIARLCEISIMGLLQLCVTKSMTQSPEKMELIRSSVKRVRKK